MVRYAGRRALVTALNTAEARWVEAMVEGREAPLVALAPLPTIPDYCRKGGKPSAGHTSRWYRSTTNPDTESNSISLDQLAKL